MAFEDRKGTHYQNWPHILVVDDDDRIRDLLLKYLQQHNYVVTTAENGDKAQNLIQHLHFDLVLLDIMMPGIDGLSFGKDLRRLTGKPIIFLSALGETQHKVEGFKNGADDYMTKPFDPEELVYRIEAILRRTGFEEATTPLQSDEYRIGPWTFRPYDMAIQNRIKSQSVPLTETENKLLSAFIKRAGHILSRDDLTDIMNNKNFDRSVDVQINRLRKKIEPDPSNPKFLKTIRGKGYILHKDGY